MLLADAHAERLIMSLVAPHFLQIGHTAPPLSYQCQGHRAGYSLLCTERSAAQSAAKENTRLVKERPGMKLTLNLEKLKQDDREQAVDDLQDAIERIRQYH